MACWGPQTAMGHANAPFTKQKDADLARSNSASDCSIFWEPECGGASSSGQTHDYLHMETSLDSLVSEHDTLACDEQLLSAEPAVIKGSGIGPRAVAPCIVALGPQPRTNSELCDMIRNEMNREAETAPSCSYMERHASSGLTPEMRTVAVSWLVEVEGAFELQQETLFLAVSYLDRFLSVAQGVPKTMLQLVAVACISLASKQEEIAQPRSQEWADVAENCFTTEDLLRMEWLVMDNLGWRGRTPTAYTFLHLYCYGLASVPAATICVASYIAELALLEYQAVGCPYSVLAAAALVVAHAVTGVPMEARSLLALAPQLDLTAVQSWAVRLVELHQVSAHADQSAATCTLPIRDKYLTDAWVRAAALPPVGVQQVLQLF